jgi:AcrR family transcriptional regulator
MTPPPDRRRDPLTVDAIVDGACSLIAEGGLAALSMRRLGDVLGVDPMAVYHHVPNKRALLSLVMARAVGDLGPTAPGASWDERVRAWARSYREVVAANRELVAAGLADPVIAAGGVPAAGPLVEAVAASGIEAALVEPNAWLVVDFVHGAALAGAAPQRVAVEDAEVLRAAFEAGLDTIVTGIAALAERGPHRARRSRSRSGSA